MDGRINFAAMDVSEISQAKKERFYQRPRFQRRLKKTLISLAILLVLAGGVGLFIGYYYEDTVKGIIVTQLNKQLNCRVEVQDIEFSVFARFPFASVHFKNVRIYDAYGDTVSYDKFSPHHVRKWTSAGFAYDSLLLKAKDVYLQMSVWDLVFGQYHVRRVEVGDALLQLKIFPNGDDNYHLLKPSSDTTGSDNFSLDLQKLTLSNVDCRYMDYPARQDYALLARDATLKGEFMKDTYELEIEGSVAVDRIKSYGTNYFRADNTFLNMALQVDQLKETVTFSRGEVRVGDLELFLKGYVAYGDDRRELALNMNGTQLSLQDFLEALPSLWQDKIKDFKGRGRFDFQAVLKGSWAGTQFPLFSAEVSLVDGEIEQRKSGIRLSRVCLKAKFSGASGQSAELTVPSFSAVLKQGDISGSFSIKNFNKPDLSLKAKGHLDLSVLNEFVQSDTLAAMSGTLDFDLMYKGQMQSSRGFSGADFVNSSSSGSLKLQDAAFEFRQNKLRFSGLNGQFKFSNNDLISENFRGKIDNNDFFIKGYFRNLLPYILLENQNLQVKADFISQHIDMEELLQYQVSSGDTLLRLDISPKLDLDFDVKVRRFSFGKFRAADIVGRMRIHNRQVLVENLSFGAMDGRVSATGLLDNSHNGQLLISCDAHLQRVDIRKMFYQLNNFGQEALTDQNLKGYLTTDIQLKSNWSNLFEVDQSSITAKAKVVIENGELIHFAPIEGLSKYMKNRNFATIKFATLTTHVNIQDRMITIPPTNIRNDVLDVDFNGTHSFSNAINYHVSVLYAEILNSNRDRQSEYGEVEDDGLHRERYYFQITGTTENPIYKKVDKAAYRENLNVRVREEKQTLKEVLKKEFEWFKKDTVNAPQKPRQGVHEPEFQMEWE